MSVLDGKTVVVTRPARSAAPFVESLTALGAEVVLLPVTAISPPDDPAALHGAVRRIDAFDWVILTSANAVEALLLAMSEYDVPLSALEEVKFAAIGPATAAALHETGREPDVVPEEFVGEGLIAVLPDVSGKKVFLPQADNARPFLREALEKGGADLTCVEAYATKATDFEIPRGPAPDYLTLTSGTGAKTVLNAAKRSRREAWLTKTVAVCIGPVTAEAAKEAGAQRVEVAEVHTVEGILEKIKELEAAHANV